MKAVYITYCSYAKPARYDVFERIGFYINNTLLCLSAPSKVTGYDDEVSESWNYLKLRPCAIKKKTKAGLKKTIRFITQISVLKSNIKKGKPQLQKKQTDSKHNMIKIK